MAYERALPRLDASNRPFWTGGEQGELRILQCQDCNGFVHPPRPVCRHCLSENVTPTVVAGTGEVYSFSVNYQKWHPEMEVPFVVARIALDGVPGVLLTSNVIGCDPESVDIGDRVKVVFENREEVWYPLFEPEAASR
jgi:hypothetical protein